MRGVDDDNINTQINTNNKIRSSESGNFGCPAVVYGWNLCRIKWVLIDAVILCYVIVNDNAISHPVTKRSRNLQHFQAEIREIQPAFPSNHKDENEERKDQADARRFNRSVER